MKNTINNYYLQSTEIQKIKLCHTIRVIVGFSKKVVFKLMSEMKNGALWLLYTVDGVKCSTFAKKLQAIKEMDSAHIGIVGSAKTYICAVAKQLGLVSWQDEDKSYAVVKVDGRQFYITFHGDDWLAYPSSRLQVAVVKGKTIKSVLQHLVNDPV